MSDEIVEHNEDSLHADAIKLLMEQLSSEYRILQDKIDKIGGFKFTIRGWSVTIVIASSIGATTAKLPSPYLLLGLIVFVILFGAMEWEQARHLRDSICVYRTHNLALPPGPAWNSRSLRENNQILRI